jgi:hypothetical protein
MVFIIVRNIFVIKRLMKEFVALYIANGKMISIYNCKRIKIMCTRSLYVL